MTYFYNPTAIPKAEHKTISPFIGIQKDMDEKAFNVFDQILANNGKFNVFETHYTDNETQVRMVRSNIDSHQGKQIDYKAYVTWKNTLHLRFEDLLKGSVTKTRNPFLSPDKILLIRGAIQNGVRPKKFIDCSYLTTSGCITNKNT
jgi:hypothetical protein